VDLPLWWLDHAIVALEAEAEAAKEQKRRGTVQSEIDRIHGGR